MKWRTLGASVQLKNGHIYEARNVLPFPCASVQTDEIKQNFANQGWQEVEVVSIEAMGTSCSMVIRAKWGGPDTSMHPVPSLVYVEDKTTGEVLIGQRTTLQTAKTYGPWIAAGAAAAFLLWVISS